MRRLAFRLPLAATLHFSSNPIVRNRRRRARHALGIGLLAVVALHLAMAAAIETVKPEWHDPEYAHRLHRLRKLQTDSPDRPLVLALGSSRSQMGLSPSHMTVGEQGPIVFNLAHSGFGPVHLSMLLHRARADGVKPSAVLIEYLPAAFHDCGRVEDLMKTSLPTLRFDDVQHLRPLCDSNELLTGWAKCRLHSFHTMRLTLISHWNAKWLPGSVRQDSWRSVDPHGWIPCTIDASDAAGRQSGLGRMKGMYFETLQDLRIGPWQSKAFRDMIASCHQNGIRVAIYTMPESPTFRSWYSPATRRRSEEFLRSLQRDTGVAVFEATTNFAEDEFADGHHILRDAAGRFSRDFWNRHLEPWLSSAR